MFDIGWTEMLVIAIVMIVVVGPKDLPKMLRTFGKMTSKMRSMAGDFQKQFNEALKEAELDDVKKSVDTLRNLNPASQIKKQLNPFEKAAADVRAGLQTALGPKPAASPEPASPEVHPAEPLKSGAADLPGVAAPKLETAPPVALATPAPSPEPAKPAASAAPMSDPAPSHGVGNGAAAKPARKAATPKKAAAASEKAADAPAKPKPRARSTKVAEAGMVPVNGVPADTAPGKSK